MDVPFCGQSMLPVIREGDRILVELFSEPQPIEQRPIGEIVVFKDEDQWVTHRVIQFKKEKYTKGDWSYSADLKKPAWGKVIAINGSKKKIRRGALLARLSAWDLSHKRSPMRRLRKLLSILFHYI